MCTRRSMLALLLLPLSLLAVGAEDPDVGSAVPAVETGRELFQREWIANDPRSPEGDGLGPMFNDSSCVACHNLGGVGGAGPVNKNVSILTRPAQGKQPATSFVLHAFSTQPEYVKWRQQNAPPMLLNGMFLNVQQIQHRQVTRIPQRVAPGSVTQRNTTALFGAGLLDQISDEAILAAAEQTFADFPEVSGRPAKLPDGGIGRFGWKAQVAHLNEFVRTACRVEMGLQLPDKDQAPTPHDDSYRAPGPDLTNAECDALVEFVASLPRPVESRPDHSAVSDHLSAGRRLFGEAGCAACHTQTLDEVDGIYSDLLLHDMGQQLSDVGSSYGVFQHSPAQREAAKPGKLATKQEWRTPPLWGLRDSAPYLHDGRAHTIEQAIQFHGGEAKPSAQRFADLSLEDRTRLINFLKSLTAPAT